MTILRTYMCSMEYLLVNKTRTQSVGDVKSTGPIVKVLVILGTFASHLPRGN